MRDALATYGAAAGVRLRPAEGPQDFAAIERIARASFPVPVSLWEKAENMRHYEASWDGSYPGGRGLVTVAVNRRRNVCGYCYFQIRADGEVYLRELGANPPEAADKAPCAGALLICELLRIALGPGCSGRVAANVLEEHRERVVWGSASPDPVSYYRQFGFRENPTAIGYTMSGRARSLDDTWLEADAGHAMACALRFLEARLSDAV